MSNVQKITRTSEPQQAVRRRSPSGMPKAKTTRLGTAKKDPRRRGR